MEAVVLVAEIQGGIPLSAGLAEVGDAVSRDFRPGETVLMQHNGWLRAFTVVGVNREGGGIEYLMQPLSSEGFHPHWTKAWS